MTRALSLGRTPAVAAKPASSSSRALTAFTPYPVGVSTSTSGTCAATPFSPPQPAVVLGWRLTGTRTQSPRGPKAPLSPFATRLLGGCEEGVAIFAASAAARSASRCTTDPGASGGLRHFHLCSAAPSVFASPRPFSTSDCTTATAAAAVAAEAAPGRWSVLLPCRLQQPQPYLPLRRSPDCLLLHRRSLTDATRDALSVTPWALLFMPILVIMLGHTSEALLCLSDSICFSFTVGFGRYSLQFIRDPRVSQKWYYKAKEGFRLFFANVRVSHQLLKKKILGYPLRYNEHKLLVRTTADALKLIPFSLLIIVPLGELLIPVDHAFLSRKLQAKQELAAFFQELLQERTRHLIEQTPAADSAAKSKALKSFQQKLLKPNTCGEPPLPGLNEILEFSRLFKDDFVINKMDLQTLQVDCGAAPLAFFSEIVMCKLLGLQPYSVRSHVMLQLRHHINHIQREDREFLWEGVDSLTHEELVEACRDRGMKFYGTTDDAMREQMRRWLEVSSHRDVPPILLLWSRCVSMIPASQLQPTATTSTVAASAPATEAATAPSISLAAEERAQQKQMQKLHAHPRDDADAGECRDTDSAQVQESEEGVQGGPLADKGVQGGPSAEAEDDATGSAEEREPRDIETELRLLRKLTDIQHESVVECLCFVFPTVAYVYLRHEERQFHMFNQVQMALEALKSKLASQLRGVEVAEGTAQANAADVAAAEELKPNPQEVLKQQAAELLHDELHELDLRMALLAQEFADDAKELEHFMADARMPEEGMTQPNTEGEPSEGQAPLSEDASFSKDVADTQSPQSQSKDVLKRGGAISV
ncbi:letm1 and ef-hand domain-containing protein [Cyclospora cayetanensis]|uniref:Letm1 and ef-hand domain-containing protein n=1 Tax=Cyclospora cayetanensis TaxID=88456 RepID=A0A1D3D469_9EIME|nr:letm1 and ef-hand domain-containing protein [Cyclospora cayetanensis]